MHQEFALASADLEHRLAVEIVPLYQSPGELTGKGIEGARKGLGFFGALGVVDRSGRKAGVLDEAACGTEAEPEVSAGKSRAVSRVGINTTLWTGMPRTS